MERTSVYDAIVIGAGIAGSVISRQLAEKQNKKILVLEQRSHIGGNCFDEKDEHGVLVHPYGPHIFHTDDEQVFSYLSRFTRWHSFGHEVVADINGTFIPVPFNLNTLKLVYGEEKAEALEKKLISSFGREKKIPILELRRHQDEDIRNIADYVYENIFLNYTMKQWGKKPEEIDGAVTARVPVHLSYDNRYFQDRYQGVPEQGYHHMFEQMLDDDRIEIRLGVQAGDVLNIRNNKICFEGTQFDGEVIYTGALDQLFDYCYGDLSYRSIAFAFEHYRKDSYQDYKVVNYTVSEAYTRITEYKKLTGQICDGTTISKEYPVDYDRRKDLLPYYPIANEQNEQLYRKYREKTAVLDKLFLLGRLAEYQYYNMDVMVKKALELAETIAERS